MEGAKARAIREWRRSLSELRVATLSFDADGIPVAIDGLKTLAAYIRATAQPDEGELDQLAIGLSNLAGANQSFEKSNRADFDIRAPLAQTFLTTVERISPSCLSESSAGTSGPVRPRG